MRELVKDNKGMLEKQDLEYKIMGVQSQPGALYVP